jgi:HEPN domain-containing protein
LKTSESDPNDWLFLARERLRAADALFAAEGVTLTGVELLQESVERFLKAFLVSNGWRLRKVHDLGFLLEECVRYDSSFSRFTDLADSLTAQFWAQHYPGGDLEGIGDNYEEMRSTSEELILLLELALAKPLPPESGN